MPSFRQSFCRCPAKSLGGPLPQPFLYCPNQRRNRRMRGVRFSASIWLRGRSNLFVQIGTGAKLPIMYGHSVAQIQSTNGLITRDWRIIDTIVKIIMGYLGPARQARIGPVAAAMQEICAPDERLPLLCEESFLGDVVGLTTRARSKRVLRRGEVFPVAASASDVIHCNRKVAPLPAQHPPSRATLRT